MEAGKESIIDSILDNYFSRNKIDAQVFFSQNKEPELQSIWERSHQQMFYDKILHTQLTECDEMPKVPLICDSAILRVQDRVRELEAELEIQAKRIRDLEQQNASYRDTISELQKENMELRTRNKNGSPPKLVTFDEEEDGSDKKANIIMVQSYMPDSGRKI